MMTETGVAASKESELNAVAADARTGEMTERFTSERPHRADRASMTILGQI
ncbi:hypothetical protein GCM10011273_16920 [Asticcacaulis endophyticus]|uniref:Uncharacterized protein n=1 Tax=Asticcacaulis endophyticus TaxID=1395890 RepID=A0A918USJ4_9CAUL|nr:hypothetical protein GCM10011273_16920 [Asticcacaulis endophyticus]